MIDVMDLYTRWQFEQMKKSEQFETTNWQQHWKDLGQHWRKEPEISLKRQQELTRRREIKPDSKQGIYPFGGIVLTRADVEWLLATHENGRGPIDWSDEQQRERQGLDLRGAQLQGVDLSFLPLAKLIGGLNFDEYAHLSEEQRRNAFLVLSGAHLFETHLEQANLRKAHMEKAYLFRAHLEQASLIEAHLEKAYLAGAHMEKAYLRGAHLEQAYLREAHLEQAHLFGVDLKQTDLFGAHLEQADLFGAHLEKADLRRAHLEQASLVEAHLKQADLKEAHLEGVQLQGAIIVEKGSGPQIADVSWGETHLSVINWLQMIMLGDEALAHEKVNDDGTLKSLSTRLHEYQRALRATYQFATVLDSQGLKTAAARFEYRARCLEQIVSHYELMTISWHEEGDEKDGVHREKKKKIVTLKSVMQGLKVFFPRLFSHLFSWFLFLIAGYGYRLRNCFFWYVLIIGIFAFLYWYFAPGSLTWQTALGESMAVFHGRGTTLIELGKGVNMNAFALCTVVEAFFGLVIEVVLVATAIQRFFNK